MATAASTEFTGASRAAPSTGGTRPSFRCDCGHRLQVFRGGRHRIYFELANVRLDDPVMDAVCPGCGRELPGKQ